MDLPSRVWGVVLTTWLTGSYDATVRLWDIKSKAFKPLMTLTEAKDSVSAVCVSGHEIFSASIDGKVRIYDIRMGTVKVDVMGRTYSPLPLSSSLRW